MITDNFLKKLTALFTTQIAAMGMGFLAHLIMIKTLSASEYGVFSFVFSVVTLLCLIGNFGFQASAVRFVPHLKTGNFTKFFHASTAFVLCFATAVSITVFALINLSPLAENYPSAALWTGAAIVPLFALIKLYSGIFKGLKKGSWALSYESTFKETALVILLLLCVVTGILATTGQSVLLLIAIIFAALAGASALHVKSLTPTDNNQGEQSESLKTWLKISAPMMFVIAAQTLIHRADIIMLGIFVTPEEVGAYAAVAKLAQAATFGFIAMNIIFSPLASEYFHQKKTAALKSLYIKTAGVQVVLTAILATALYIAGPYILDFFGAEYATAINVLYLLIAGYTLNCLWGPVPFLMIMTKFEHFAMWITFAATALNIALNIIFIQEYGIWGAALATVITLNLRNAISLAYVWKRGIFNEAQTHG